MSNVITTSRRDGFTIHNTINRTIAEIEAHPAVRIAKDWHDQLVQAGYGHEFGVEVRTDHLDKRFMPDDMDGYDYIEIDVFFNYDTDNIGAVCRTAKSIYRKFMRAKGLKLDWPNGKETWVPEPSRAVIFHDADVSWRGSVDRNEFLDKNWHRVEEPQMKLFPDFLCSAKEITVWTPWEMFAD